MALDGSLELVVRTSEDVLLARQAVQRFAAKLLFGRDDLARVEIVTSELASNMVKHAHGGTLTVERLDRPGQRGLRLIALDRGPGIGNLQEAMESGFSTAGSSGEGLPAVRELVDKFELTSLPGHWTRVEVEKWQR